MASKPATSSKATKATAGKSAAKKTTSKKVAPRKAAPKKTASRKRTPKQAALKKSTSSKRTTPKVQSTSKTKSARISKAELDARQGVIATALKMSVTGLSPGRSGNVSCRWNDGMLITPSGMPYEQIKSADIVFVDGNGQVDPRAKKPSSEWRFHLSAYKARPDMDAVVHTHSLHAVVLACAHKPIPAFHYMVALAGGDHIPLIPYAPFGTEKLADYVAVGISQIDACLMANHGQIALGKSLQQALELAQEIEIMAQQYVKVLTLGLPRLLRRREMQDVLERIKTYGQHAQK